MKTHHIAEYIYKALFFLLPLVFASSTTELFELNKTALLMLSAIGMGFCIVLSDRRHTFMRIPFGVGIIALVWLTVNLATTVFSVDPAMSLGGYYGRFNAGLTTIMSLAVLMIGFARFGSAALVRELIVYSAITAVIVVAWGIPGFFHKDMTCFLYGSEGSSIIERWKTTSNACWVADFRPAERMFSTLGQPNWAGAYLTIVLFAVWGLRSIYIKATNTYQLKSNVLTIALPIITLGILLTKSRSAIGALVIGVGVLVIYSFQQTKKLRLQTWIFVLSIILCMAVVKTNIAVIDNSLSRLLPTKHLSQASPTTNSYNTQQAPTDNSKASESLDIRKIVWQGALETGKQHLLLGTGLETFAIGYYQNRPVAHNMTTEWDYLYNKAHNEFLNYFATTGLTGLVAYLLFLGAGYYVLYLTAKRSSEQYIVLCLTLAYTAIHITNFFGFSTTTTQLFLYMIPLFAFALAKPQTYIFTLSEKIHQGVLVGGVGILSIALWNLISWYSADMTFARGQNMFSSGAVTEGIDAMQQAIAIHYEPSFADKLSSSLAAAAPSLTEEYASYSAKLIESATAYNAKTLLDSPRNPWYWKTTLLNSEFFYDATNDPVYLEQAIRIGQEKLRVLSPTDPRNPYHVGLSYEKLADSTHLASESAQYLTYAITELNSAIALKPDYRDALYEKAIILKKQGGIENLQQAALILDAIVTKDSVDKDALNLLEEIRKLLPKAK